MIEDCISSCFSNSSTSVFPYENRTQQYMSPLGDLNVTVPYCCAVIQYKFREFETDSKFFSHSLNFF